MGFQDFKDAAITQSGACAEAAKKVLETAHEWWKKVGGNGLCTADSAGMEFIGDVRGRVASRQECMDLCTERSECIGITGGTAMDCELEARDCDALVKQGLPSGFTSLCGQSCQKNCAVLGNDGRGDDYECWKKSSISYTQCIENLRTTTCDFSKVVWPEGWGTSGGAADLASIRANPAIAWAVDCFCKSDCKTYQDFQAWPARTTDTGACAVAASVTNTYAACQNSAEGIARYQKCTTDSYPVQWDDMAPETELEMFQGNADIVYTYYCVCNSLCNQFPPLWADPVVVAGGCTQATYANCFNALKYDKKSSPYVPDAPTCSDKNIKWSEVGYTHFANAQKDIVTIRANPAFASFIDCVCKSVCGEFQDFKDAAITQSGACAEAAKKVASSSSNSNDETSSSSNVASSSSNSNDETSSSSNSNAPVTVNVTESGAKITVHSFCALALSIAFALSQQ